MQIVNFLPYDNQSNIVIDYFAYDVSRAYRPINDA